MGVVWRCSACSKEVPECLQPTCSFCGLPMMRVLVPETEIEKKKQKREAPQILERLMARIHEPRLELATCGCQLPGFECVICKKRYTSLLPTTPCRLPIYPTYRAGLPFYIPTYLPYRTARPAATYQLPRAYSRLPDPTAYYCYRNCVSERSEVCPKKILCPDGYICATCRAESILEMYWKNVNPCLQSLLELTY